MVTFFRAFAFCAVVVRGAAAVVGVARGAVVVTSAGPVVSGPTTVELVLVLIDVDVAATTVVVVLDVVVVAVAAEPTALLAADGKPVFTSGAFKSFGGSWYT
jgi:hypothetical protein